MEIRRMRWEDEADLLRFLGRAYPAEPRKSDPGHWRWQFRDHPLVGDGPPPLWLALRQGRIIGQLAALPAALRVGGETVRSAWVLEFLVDAAHRGQGIGKRLVAAAQSEHPILLTLGINAQSRAVFVRLGWRDLGRMPRFHRLLYPGNTGTIPPPLSWLANTVWGFSRRGLPAIPRGIELRTLPAVTALDQLWRRAAGQFPCTAIRDAATVGWQFERQPGKRFEIIAAFRDRDLAGYAVLFYRTGRRPPKVSIADLLYTGPSALQTIRALIAESVHRAVTRRAGQIVVDVRDRVVESELRNHGFQPVPGGCQFMVSPVSALPAAAIAANWYLTRADADVGIFEEPNVPA